MKISIKGVLKIVIILLTMLSLFYTFYEFDNYKRQYNSSVFMYKEGLYKVPSNVEELFNNEAQSYLNIINRFEQLLCLNLIIVGLTIIYCWLIKISTSSSKSPNFGE
jgi:hypothetical protein